ncbi:cation channel sperm-associated auxiliary subunit epsilon [Rhineura floridana]|uniref:cation channel sperm-associated auxiliary subunit epsilon n=1 Tax=Rhineura floridana TaxID=261503 RepID=UPI002AC82FB2|nr:cation channel sperm-associated auxiliary subunit epsilon [Rhineura floridana]
MARFFSPLVWAGPLLLYLWLSGCWAVWRYTTRIGHYILFTGRTTIFLEYEGTSFTEWEIPILCSAGDKSSPQTTLNCPVAGAHKIMPVVTNPTFEDKERYLTLNVELSCFLWYVYSSLSSADKSSKDVIIWVYDPENAEPSEVDNTATKPPAHSRALSRQFSNLGQAPFIKTFFKGIEYTEAEFTDEGYWKIKVPILSDDIIGQVYGKPITFQGCFTAQSPFVIAQSEIPQVNIHDISISTPAGSEIMLTWSACFPTTAVLVSDFGAFLTHNGFQDSKEIKFPSTVLDRAKAQSVNDVAVINSYSILFLIEDSVYIMQGNNVYKAGQKETFPENGVIGIHSRTWCEADYPTFRIILSESLIWTKSNVYVQYATENVTELMLLVMETGTLKKLIGFSDGVDVTVITACYASVPSEISVLLACVGCSSTRTLYLVGHSEVEGHWFLRDFSLPAPTTGVMYMEVLFSATPTMLLWYSDKVFYSYKGNKVNGYVKISGTDTILSAASEGTEIHQVITDYGGNTVIKMKNNAMFFLKFNMKDVVKLNAWEVQDKDYVLYVNPHGDLYLLTMQGPNTFRQTYPLKTEILSATHTSKEICPYISFQHNLETSVYFINKGDNVTFWAQIVFLENVGLSTEIIIHNSELLKQTRTLHYEIARGICTKNQTITLYHDRDYSKETEYADAMQSSTGIMTIELQPSTTGRTCMTINKEIQYDERQYGCPIDVHYAAPFRPTVYLYDGEKYIDIVQSEYMLWEVNARNDFRYNTTIEQVRCLRRAQNMSSMVPKDIKNISGDTIDDFWGPQNYRSCFESAGEGLLGSQDKPYEILNHSGINSIIWPQYYTGIFMFRLKILDPNYSFCDRGAYFAVRTYGITESFFSISYSFCSMSALFVVHTYGVIEGPNWLLTFGCCTLIMTLFLGILVFSYFRNVKTFLMHSFVDPLLSLHPHVRATQLAKELKKEIVLPVSSCIQLYISVNSNFKIYA